MSLLNLIPPQYRIAALIGVVVVIFWSGWSVNGWRLGEQMSQWQTDLANARTQASENAREAEQLSMQLSIANGQAFAARQQAEDAKSSIIEKEVIKYVQAPYSGQCNLPNQWVRIDTASATGRLPEDVTTVSGADDAPSGITDADAIVTIRDRNKICRKEINKVIGLQDYIRSQLKVINKSQYVLNK